eukprot:g12715.t1
MGCVSSASVTPLDTAEGQFFQHYKLGKKLGEGAFGQVRLTTRMDSGEMYAVKIMDVRSSRDVERLDQDILRRAKNEARLLKEVSGHPNVVALHETYLESPGLFYMIMERCYGSLMDSLCDMPKLTEIWLRRMFRQMLLGIGACHNAGIVHRALNATGAVLDVWSFASTVYVILYGDVPYSPSQPTAASVKKAIVNAFPPPAWMRNAKLAKHYQQPSSGAETFCRYLLVRDPQKRPSINDALNHPFENLSEGPMEDMDEDEQSVVIETAGERVRTITDMFKAQRKPIISRNLDEVLERLERAGPPLPEGSFRRGVSAGRCFTEELPQAEVGFGPAEVQEAGRRKTSMDGRIVRQSVPREQPPRSYTHSGVTDGQDSRSGRG